MDEGGDRAGAATRTLPSQAVVEAVAEAEGVRPEELCPPEYETLHDVVDPQALDALFAPKANGIERSPGRISFEFCGHVVTVDADGTVSLTEARRS